MRFKTIIVGLVIVLFYYLTVFAANYDPSGDVNALKQQLKDFAGSKSAIEQNVSQSLFSPVDMRNLSNTEHFNAQIQCPGTKKAITVTFVPNSTTHGWTVYLKQDVNADSTFDHQVAFDMTGACQRGFLQGSFGSGQLTYYKFISNNGKIDFIQASSSAEVGTCVCAIQGTVQSCGNIPPYEILGGAVMSLLMQDGSFVFGKSEWDMATFTFNIFGQARVNCSGLSSSSWDQYGEQNPSHYYSSGQYPHVSLADIALSQGNDPNSYYSLMNSVQTNVSQEGIGLPNIVTCNIYRAPQCIEGSVNYQWVETNECQSFENDEGCQLKEEEIDGIATVHNYLKTGYTPQNVCENITCTKSDSISGSGRQQVCTDHVIYFKAEQVGDTLELRYWPNGVGEDGCWYNCGCPRVQYRVLETVQLGQLMRAGAVIESINYCITIYPKEAIPAGCTKRGGFSGPVTACSTGGTVEHPVFCPVGGGQYPTLHYSYDVRYRMSATHQVCSWRHKKKTYVCNEQNINIDLTRAGVINETAKDVQGTITATDPVTGQIQANYPKGQSCEKKYCMVQTATQNKAVYGDTTNAVQAGQQNSKQYEVRECNPQCPVNQGEVIYQSCNCGDIGGGFSLAVTTMEAVNQAVKSMICVK